MSAAERMTRSAECAREARWCGIPVEYKGGTTPPPDERRTYS
jgi:hypothetical protein